jgi:hypothetical protein
MKRISKDNGLAYFCRVFMTREIFITLIPAPSGDIQQVTAMIKIDRTAKKKGKHH